MVVANHESILDSFALVGVFPEPVVFVAGGDLATHPITGPFLRGLGATFVRLDDGTDRSSVRAVLAELAGLARAGHRLVFFPEGGLSPGPGCAGSNWERSSWPARRQPCLPVAILGTRDLFPPGARLPRRDAVEVRFGETLGTAPSGWKGRLRGSSGQGRDRGVARGRRA